MWQYQLASKIIIQWPNASVLIGLVTADTIDFQAPLAAAFRSLGMERFALVVIVG